MKLITGMLAACAALLLLANAAIAVPLAEWEADEAKLLGEEPVTRADLPDEWQGLGNDELRALMEEVRAGAEERFNTAAYSEALPEFQQCAYLARALGDISAAGKALNVIGTIYQALGQYDQALEHYRTSLAIYREVGDQQGEGKSLHNIGNILLLTGRYEQALEQYDQAMVIFREVEDLVSEGKSLNNTGVIYEYLGLYDQALEYYEQSLANKRETGEIQQDSSTMNNIGNIYNSMGHYEQAVEYYNRALTVARNAGDVQDESNWLNNIGLVYERLEQYEQALEIYEQSLAIFREIGDIRGEGTALNNIGIVYDYLGQYDQALEYYKQSLKIASEIEDNRVESSSLNNIGAVLDCMGQHEQALEYCKQSLALRREADDTHGAGKSLINIGVAYERLKQHDLALDYYAQSLAIFREIGDVSSEGEALNNIGNVYESLGDFDLALEHRQGAFEIARQQATQFTWETGIKGGLTESLGETGSKLALVQLELNEPAAAFATVQAAKGVPLLQLLAQAQVQSDDHEVQQRLSSYRNANAALQSYREELLYLEEDDTDQQEYINERIAQYQVQANDAWDYLREHAPQITEIIEVKSLTVAEVQQQVLSPGQVVLEYVVLEGDAQRGEAPEIAVFCLPQAGELTVGRSILPELDEGVELKDWLEARVTDLYAEDAAVSGEAGRALYDVLIAPVAGQIPAGADLLICPDRELFIVPFEALQDGAGAYLLEGHPISYSTSATMLSYLKPTAEAEGELVAGVSFGASAEEEALSQLIAMRSADPVRGGLFQQNLPPLPGVAEETRAVADVLGCEPLLDGEVTEAELRKAMPGKRVVHVATHGYLSEIPLLNGIVTYLVEDGDTASDGAAEGGIDLNTEDDGFLTMAEVMGIPLDGCALVTLSACHGAEGGIAPGEGVMGLTQGFMYAGARSVLASLTKVDDEATRELMVQFYTNWESGLGKRAALQAAKQSLAASAEHALPRYWAPFVLYGVE